MALTHVDVAMEAIEPILEILAEQTKIGWIRAERARIRREIEPVIAEMRDIAGCKFGVTPSERERDQEWADRLERALGGNSDASG